MEELTSLSKLRLHSNLRSHDDLPHFDSNHIFLMWFMIYATIEYASCSCYLNCMKILELFLFILTWSSRLVACMWQSSTDQATMDIMLPLSCMLALILYSATIGVIIVTCVVTWPVIFAIIPLGWVYFQFQVSIIFS